MIVLHVSLADFRNYAHAEVALHAGPNVFVGRNGQGKTNLAEAIAFFATLGSHRVSQDAPMVRAGADAAFVRARLAHGDRRVQLEAQINRSGSNKARVNGSPVRVAELPRYAHVVLFAPEDLQIVRGDPASRRRFVDQLLIQRSPRMAGVISDYERVVKQRNALLKSARARGLKDDSLSTLDVWDDKLVQLGTDVIRARLALTAELSDPVARAYETIAGADHRPELSWALSVAGADADDDDSTGDADSGGALVNDSAAVSDAFRDALHVKRSAERERGVTLVGPHRDDLLLSVRGLPVKGFASHGESWSVALSLRLGSAELLRAVSSLGDPVLILDDVFAELDADRRARLAGIVAGYEQVVITAAVEADVPHEVRSRTVYVEAGTVREGERTMSSADAIPETIATYLRLRGLEPSARKVRRNKRRFATDDENAPFTAGRDPRGLGDIVADLTRDAGWDSQLAREELVLGWESAAGSEVAQHATPIALRDGVLTVKCDSTAWAKNLHMMRGSLVATIQNRYPDAGVTDMMFQGPDAPSWNHGLRAVPGRGPRDTYG